MITVSWATIKRFADDRSLSLSYVDTGGDYHIRAVADGFELACDLNKALNIDEVAEFEASYKTAANKSNKAEVITQFEKRLSWTLFKSFITTRSLSIQWVETDDSYDLTAVDGSLRRTCLLMKNAADTTDLDDFVSHYKSLGNASFSDIDGIPFMRLKASKKGWSFWALPIEITTSTLGGSVYAKDAAGVDVPGISCKIYDGNNAEITTAGLANINLASCVKTVLDFEPAFDYEMIGGALRINSNPAVDIRLWIVGAPDIPAMYGGSKEFASGINLKFLAPDSSFEIDGRVTKYVTYSAVTHSGKLRIILKHPPGTTINLQAIIHTYRL